MPERIFPNPQTYPQTPSGTGTGGGGGDMLAANNLSELPDKSMARANLDLGNVDNTTDSAKPISAAVATALAGKQAAGAYITGNQTITISGDAAGTGATAITLTLAAVNANVGTFGSSTLIPVVTVDGKGRITAISTVAAAGGGGGTPTSRLITTTAPLTGGGDLTADRTLAISAATTAAAGSMSAADKTKLDAITGTNTGDETATSVVSKVAGQTIAPASVAATTSVGYGTGAGGFVTQLTSKSTTVVLNKPCGQITMNAAALAAGAIVTFTLTNSAALAEDTILTTHHAVGTYGAYLINARVTAAGTISVAVRNTSAASLAEGITIKFAIVRTTVS